MKCKPVLWLVVVGLISSALSCHSSKHKPDAKVISYFSSYLGERNFQVPFVMDVSNKYVEYYRAPYLAIQIEKITVDGQPLEPESKDVMLDDFDGSTISFSTDQHVFIENIRQLTTIIECSTNDYTAWGYCLPLEFENADIEYRVRTTAGVSEEIYLLQLKADPIAKSSNTPSD